MMIGIARSAAAMALTATVVLHGGNALAVKAYSASGGYPAVTLEASTKVAKLKLPPGTYTISGNGLVRNEDSTQVAYVECTVSATSGTTGGVADIVVPVALSAGVPGGANWSFATTLVKATSSPTRVTVTCVNFGPAASSKIKGSYWNLVAVPITKDRHQDYFR